MAHGTQLSIGEIISNLFEEYLKEYEDEQIASVATAATVNKWLCELETPPPAVEEAEQAA